MTLRNRGNPKGFSTVNDILVWLASGITIQEILSDYDELKEDNIYPTLSYAAEQFSGSTSEFIIR